MGQAIDYNPDEWDFQEGTELVPIISEISLPTDFFKGEPEPQALFDESSDEPNIIAYIGGEKVQINHNVSGSLAANPEELAFRRQIEDLFELLELEKESGKTEGVRVYQTDSSPSRPWRFH